MTPFSHISRDWRDNIVAQKNRLIEGNTNSLSATDKKWLEQFSKAERFNKKNKLNELMFSHNGFVYFYTRSTISVLLDGISTKKSFLFFQAIVTLILRTKILHAVFISLEISFRAVLDCIIISSVVHLHFISLFAALLQY